MSYSKVLVTITSTIESKIIIKSTQYFRNTLPQLPKFCTYRGKVCVFNLFPSICLRLSWSILAQLRLTQIQSTIKFSGCFPVAITITGDKTEPEFHGFTHTNHRKNTGDTANLYGYETNQYRYIGSLASCSLNFQDLLWHLAAILSCGKETWQENRETTTPTLLWDLVGFCGSRWNLNRRNRSNSHTLCTSDNTAKSYRNYSQNKTIQIRQMRMKTLNLVCTESKGLEKGSNTHSHSYDPGFLHYYKLLLSPNLTSLHFRWAHVGKQSCNARVASCLHFTAGWFIYGSSAGQRL